MRESLDVSTQLTQVTEVDVTRIVQLRAKAKDGFAAREGAKLTFLPFFVQATAEALQQHPALNASMTEDYKQITYHGSENIAIAVDTPKGLLVPVIKNASDLGIAGLAKAIGDLGGRARTGDISPRSCRVRPSPSPTLVPSVHCSTPRSSTSRTLQSSVPVPS